MFSCPPGTALSLLSSELNLDLPLPLSHVGGDGDSFKLSLLKDGTLSVHFLKVGRPRAYPPISVQIQSALRPESLGTLYTPEWTGSQPGGSQQQKCLLGTAKHFSFLIFYPQFLAPFLNWVDLGHCAITILCATRPHGNRLEDVHPFLIKMERKVLNDDCPFYLELFLPLCLFGAFVSSYYRFKKVHERKEDRFPLLRTSS